MNILTGEINHVAGRRSRLGVKHGYVGRSPLHFTSRLPDCRCINIPSVHSDVFTVHAR